MQHIALRWACALAAGIALCAPAIAQKVRLSTTAGDIVVQLDPEKAPKTVENFLGDVKAGHYNGTIFHRVINDFMIQGGGMTPDMKEKPTRPPIVLEARNGLTNKRGTLAMARTSVPNSATSQFFINVRDNDFLNAANSPDGNGYAVFGRVVEGMDTVVEKIKTTPTGNKGGHENVPLQAIVINKATVEN